MAPKFLYYSICDNCGADDCRYHPLPKLCPVCGAKQKVDKARL